MGLAPLPPLSFRIRDRSYHGELESAEQKPGPAPSDVPKKKMKQTKEKGVPEERFNIRSYSGDSRTRILLMATAEESMAPC